MTFFKLTSDMAKEIRGIRLTAAEWRLWSYLVTLDPFGDRYMEMPDMFTIMAECEMSKATVYRAIAKFQEHGLFDFQAQIKFRNLKAEKPVSNLRQNSQICETTLKNETATSNLRKPSAETTVYQDSSLSQTNQTLLDQQTNSSPVVGESEVGEEIDLDADPEVAPTHEEMQATINKVRSLGIRVNPTIQQVMRAYYANVDDAIAHLKERIASREQFRNLEGAFVKACKEGAKPENLSRLGSGMPTEVNPPSIEQLTALEQAKESGTIRDYFLSTDGVCKVVMPNGIQMVPWWEFLGVKT